MWQVFKSDWEEGGKQFVARYRSRRSFRFGCYAIATSIFVIVLAVSDITSDDTRKNIAAVGAIFGLGGIPIVAFLNAYFTRRRDDELRSKEVRAIISALRAEIDTYRWAVEIGLNARGEDPGGPNKKDIYATRLLGLQTEFKRPIHSDVYRSVLDRIGQLGPELASQLVAYYAQREYIGFQDDVAMLEEAGLISSYDVLVGWLKTYQITGQNLSNTLTDHLKTLDQAAPSSR